MSEPGDRRIPSTNERTDEARHGWYAPHSRDGGRPPRSQTATLLLAVGVVLLTATAWALLRGILELGFTALAASALGGWGIGALVRRSRAAVPLAVLLGLTAWVLGLVFSWLLAMALLPGSSRTFAERLQGTPFLDWLSPQLGLLEVAGLLVTVAAAAYGARGPVRARS